jgi:hypothetical protein
LALKETYAQKVLESANEVGDGGLRLTKLPRCLSVAARLNDGNKRLPLLKACSWRSDGLGYRGGHFISGVLMFYPKFTAFFIQKKNVLIRL